MGHPQIVNTTPYVFEALFLVDENFQPLVVPVLKATFNVTPAGQCVVADAQVPLNFAGELRGDDAGTSSYKYEPEVAFAKPGTDVVLNGHAYTQRSGQTEALVSVRVGPLSKQLLVYGDRAWVNSLGSIAMTKPLAFERMPLEYERAFGGWDRDHTDERRHACELRNPVGTGFRCAGSSVDGVRLPNIEDPRSPIKRVQDRPAPAGVGFVSPHWQPRAALAGTFDGAWRSERSPLLPLNFDRRHLNAASPGLVAPGHLRGDEVIELRGVTLSGSLTFRLPALPPPTARVTLQAGVPTPVPLMLDTVIIEPDESRVLLIWRGLLVLRSGPHDVREIRVSSTVDRH